MDGNQFTKILNCVNDHTLSGFLYYKITETLDKGIDIKFDFAVERECKIISVYDLAEIIGIVLDNAIEAVLNNNLEKLIKIEIVENQEQLKICVKNVSKHYNNNEIEKFFQPDYSTKGKGRGIGMSKISDYQKKYGFDIYIEMCWEDFKEWLSISIVKKCKTKKLGK